MPRKYITMPTITIDKTLCNSFIGNQKQRKREIAATLVFVCTDRSLKLLTDDHVTSVTTEPSDKQNLSPGFIQLRTPARINICSITQKPLGTKLETI